MSDGKTHYPGCVREHPDCAEYWYKLAKKYEVALEKWRVAGTWQENISRKYWKCWKGHAMFMRRIAKEALEQDSAKNAHTEALPEKDESVNEEIVQCPGCFGWKRLGTIHDCGKDKV